MSRPDPGDRVWTALPSRGHTAVSTYIEHLCVVDQVHGANGNRMYVRPVCGVSPRATHRGRLLGDRRCKRCEERA